MVIHKKYININLLIYAVMCAVFILKNSVDSTEVIENYITSTDISETNSDFDINNKTRNVPDRSLKTRSTDITERRSQHNKTRFGKVFNTTIYSLPQLPGFNSSDLTSGPIVFFDERTIFIANLNFSGENKNSHFWAGKGTSFEHGFMIPDQNDSLEPLNEYTGKNQIFITVPENWSLAHTDYFGIWSNLTKTNFGYVSLSEIDKDGLRVHQPDATGRTKTPFLFPKCCPLGTNFDGGCKETEDEFNVDPVIFDSNATHIDPNKTLTTTTLDVQTYAYELSCEPGQSILPLGEETYGFIYNMSLIINDDLDKSIYPHGSFCLDQIENDTWTTTIICYQSTSDQTASMPDLYLPLLSISMICFGICALCYAFLINTAHAQHRTYFVVYSSAMFVTFFSLMILQTTDSNVGCILVGSIFVVATMVSFTWLSILTFDLVCMVKHFKEKQTSDKIFWYTAFSVGTSFVVLMLSLFINSASKPNIPNTFIKQYSSTHCEFKDSNISMFFTPMGLLILLSFGCLMVTFHYIRIFDKVYRSEHDWLDNREKYKFLLRSYVIIVTLAAFWLAEAIFNLYAMQKITKLAFDLIEASLGVVTIIIFVLNRYSWRDMKKKISWRKQKTKNQEIEIELNGYATPATPGSPTSNRIPQFPEVCGNEENQFLDENSKLELERVSLVKNKTQFDHSKM